MACSPVGHDPDAHPSSNTSDEGHDVMFHPKDRLDRLFEIGIIAKGLNGLVEVIGGCCCCS